MFIVRVGVMRFRQGAGNALTQLTGRRFGKCHNEELIDIRRIFRIRNPVKNALHQHCRLTASRSGADQDVPFPRLYHLLLFIRPCHGHFLISLSVNVSLSDVFDCRTGEFNQSDRLICMCQFS